MRTLEYSIDGDFDGKKLYSFLKGSVHLSTKLIRSLKRTENGLLINGAHAKTPDILKIGDIVTLNIPDDEKTAEPGETMPQVIYEDSDILVVNKPSFMPIHESHNHQGDTLANCVCGYLSKKGMNCSFRSVGRLDKGTSGLVVCALNSHAAARLSGKIEKTYYAIATGHFEGCGTIDKPIYRPDPMKTLRTADDRGDRAVTHWEALASNGELTLLKVRLETGRTHQIRVHFAFLGAPLLGDRMYGKEREDITRQALHCGEAAFIQPVTGEKIVCKVEMPEDMKAFADLLQRTETLEK